MPATQEAPNVSTGNSQAVGFAARTGIQAVISNAIVRLITVIPEPDLVIDDFDRDLISGAALLAVAFVQNFIEQRRNRRFIGPAPTPAVADEPRG